MSPSAPDLETQARTFAREVQHLLNNTVTVGQTISSVLTDSGTCIVGRSVTPRQLLPQRIPLAVRPRAKPRAYLLVAHTFQLDPEGVWLTAARSGYAIYLTDDPDEDPMFRYDYEREPDHGYAPAHFHIRGASSQVAELLKAADRNEADLDRLHFPVGGKRFRPTLEDVVEFLIQEGLVEHTNDWDHAVALHRHEWEERQVKAAVRRHPEWARRELEDGSG